MCGVNCLYIISKLGDDPREFNEVAGRVSVDPKRGSSLQELAEAASGLGLTMEVRRIPRADLAAVPTPFIAHLDYLDEGRAGHFFVVLYVDADGAVECLDGTDGSRMNLSREYMERHFSGYVLAPSGGPRLGVVALAGMGGIASALLIGFMAARRGRPRNAESEAPG